MENRKNEMRQFTLIISLIIMLLNVSCSSLARNKEQRNEVQLHTQEVIKIIEFLDEKEMLNFSTRKILISLSSQNRHPETKIPKDFYCLWDLKNNSLNRKLSKKEFIHLQFDQNIATIDFLRSYRKEVYVLLTTNVDEIVFRNPPSLSYTIVLDIISGKCEDILLEGELKNYDDVWCDPPERQHTSP